MNNDRRHLTPAPRRRACRRPRALGVRTLLVGIWLVLAPAVWGYGDTGGGFDARWNDLTVGAAVVAAGCAQLVRPARFSGVAVSMVLGVWLAIAPFALAYDLGADSTSATANDTIAGTLLTGFAVSGYLSTRATSKHEQHT